MFTFEDEEDAREDDLDFLDEIRTADLAHLWKLRVILAYGAAPRWMMIAVERAIARMLRRRRLSEPKP
jgi:hypothetical protein